MSLTKTLKIISSRSYTHAKSLAGDDTARSTGKEEIGEEHFGEWGRH